VGLHSLLITSSMPSDKLANYILGIKQTGRKPDLSHRASVDVQNMRSMHSLAPFLFME
jgi:hypothetical protein